MQKAWLSHTQKEESLNSSHPKLTLYHSHEPQAN